MNLKRQWNWPAAFAVALAALAITSAPASAQAPDGASLEYGAGEDAQIARIGLQWHWTQQWLQSDTAHLSGYWDLTLANWDEKRYLNQAGDTRRITDIGLTPVFRYENNNKLGLYYEIAVGAHWLSSLYDNDRHQLATPFEFGDHLAIGYQFANNWDASLKLQHFSNGGIKRPNGGVDFLMLRLAKQF